MSEENFPKDVTYLTREGMRKLETELAHLRTDGRAEVAQRLHQALEEGGDLLENAEFEAAKNEQAFVEGRIMTIETLLLHAKIIKKSSTATGIIGLGSVVVIKEEGGKAETYKIVGAAEANPADGSISNESPLGKALLGQKQSSKVRIKAPGGELIFRIVKVS